MDSPTISDPSLREESDSAVDELALLARLAWPAVAGQLGLMLMGVVDTMAIGRVSEDAMAAVGLGTTWSFVVTIVAMGILVGLDPLMSQAFGAGDKREAGRGLAIGLVMVPILSVPVIALHLIVGPVFRLIGEPAAVIDDAWLYCAIMAIGAVPMLAGTVIRQFLQAGGLMWPGAVAVVVANVVNLILNVVLVPRFGVAGSAAATLVSRFLIVGVLVALGWPLLRGTWPGWAAGAEPRELGKAARLGFPVGIQLGLEVWAFSASTLICGRFGQIAVDGHLVALSLASLSFMMPLGISAAASARVGNLLGAGRRWQRSGAIAIAGGVGAMACSAIVFALLPGPLATLFTPKESVVAVAVTLIPIVAGFQLFDGIQGVTFGVLRGAGDTRVPMIANIIGYWLVGLPLGTWLAFHYEMGPRGLWYGLTVGLVLVATILLLRLRVTAARGGTRV